MTTQCMRCGRKIIRNSNDTKVSMFCDFCQGRTDRADADRRSVKPLITHLSLGDSIRVRTVRAACRRIESSAASSRASFRRRWFHI